MRIVVRLGFVAPAAVVLEEEEAVHRAEQMEVEVRSEGREAEANPAKLAGLRRGADFRIALWLPGTLLMSGTVGIPGTVNQLPE